LRRMVDLSRLLPVFGLIAFLAIVPLLIGVVKSSTLVVFFFFIWLGLIVSAAVLSRILKRIDDLP